MNNTNPLNNQNYINKDFQTIYPELLDLIKKLTYKWDPTISNESDPGVLLVKLNAIIADKNNYNIDKNLLECFPDSVTQESNAHKLYEQLGYCMHWYKSATDNITMKWESGKVTVNGSAVSYTVPQFTMVCDADKEIVYTTLSDVDVNTDGTNVTVDVMQGVIKDYSFGTTTLINASFLDSNNRLFFPITNVAENGIFISDAHKDSIGNPKFIWDRSGYDTWKRVDNLHIQPTGTKCYKFGVDQITNSCYIEFPIDISDLMGEGIYIKYLQTEGKSGNIAVNRLKSFYHDIEYKQVSDIDKPTRTISKDIKLWNVNSITNGSDMETIDEAYVGYQRQVGTFDTLVTLADYLNYIVDEDLQVVSNGVVSDRTNDIQSSYKIVTLEDTASVVKSIICKTDNKEEMSPYDLKTYFLNYSDISKISTDTSIESQKSALRKDYDKSFNLKFGDVSQEDELGLGTSLDVKMIYDESKSIQHNFINKLPNRPLFFKNKFDLNLTIIPNTMVTQSQADEIEKNVYEALYRNLISKNISFGKELTYETIYDICNKADTRIKAVALDNINYETYAVVYVHFEGADDGLRNKVYKDVKGQEITFDNEGIYEILVAIKEDINNSHSNTWGEDIALEVAAKNVLAGVTPMYVEDSKFKFDISHTETDLYKSIETVDTSTEIIFENLQENQGKEKTQNILNNESLILYAPSLIELPGYSVSVKYLYFTTDEYTGTYVDYLPANRDVVLEKGQYLFAFWKTEDSKDAPYLYAKHGPGDIIHSTTRLKIAEMDADKSIRNRLISAKYEGEGQILGDLNDALYDISDTILTSSKVITPKKINSAKLNDTRTDCYWITNKVETDNNGNKYYDMVFKFNDSLDATTIDRVYQSGQIYVSNFGLDRNTAFLPQTLESNEKIYVLEPKSYVITYSDYNEDSETVFETTKTVTDYIVIDIIEADTTIVCTGPIYKNETYFSNLSGYKVGDTIRWGKRTPNGDYENTSTGKTKYFDKIETYDLPNSISDSLSCVLKTGYKIEKYAPSDNIVGEGNEESPQTLNPEKTSIFSYRLKTNEYFVYTNDNRDALYILEDGTTINIEVPNDDRKIKLIMDDNKIVGVEPITLKVKAILDTDTIQKSDMRTFKDDMWYTFSPTSSNLDEDGKIALDNNGRAISLDSGMIPEIVENQIIKLGADTTMGVTLNHIVYKLPDGEETFHFDPRYNNLKINSEGVWVAPNKTGSETDFNWVLDSNALLQYTIRYKDKNETTFTPVPQVDTNDLSWDAYTILSINAGANSPQELKSNHAITLYPRNCGSTDENGNEITPITLKCGSLPTYLQTNYTISLAGGDGINVTAESAEGEIYYIDIYKYQMDSIVDTYGSHRIEKKDGNYVVTFGDNTNLSLPMSITQLTSELNNVEMILPIKILDDVDNISRLSVEFKYKDVENKDATTTLAPIGYDSLPQEGSTKIRKGTYYYKLTKKVAGNLVLSANGTNYPISIQLLPIFSYTYNEELNKMLSMESLEPELLEWDIDRIFDYTYQPLADNKILNPLESKSFFNRNHLYNRYVIPQISNIKINTTNKRA